MKKLERKLNQIKKCMGTDILITLGMTNNKIEILDVRSADEEKPSTEYIG